VSHLRYRSRDGDRDAVAAIRPGRRGVDHVAARLQPVDRRRGGLHRPRRSGGRDRRGDADLSRPRLAGSGEDWSATVARPGRGVALEGVTVGYNALEGVIAIAAGLAAGSVALTGFGIDSVIEVTSGVVLWWRLRAELGAARVGPAVEAWAARWAGILLLALAVYIMAESGRRLLTG